eukprot:868828-Pyramimonas_sp.AAC.1
MQHLTTGIIGHTRTTTTTTTSKKQNDKPIAIRTSNVKKNYQEIDLIELSEAPLNACLFSSFSSRSRIRARILGPWE